jgi:hypothetical protein
MDGQDLSLSLFLPSSRQKKTDSQLELVERRGRDARSLVFGSDTGVFQFFEKARYSCCVIDKSS